MRPVMDSSDNRLLPEFGLVSRYQGGVFNKFAACFYFTDGFKDVIGDGKFRLVHANKLQIFQCKLLQMNLRI